MIENLPSAEGLNKIAIRLYFSAWTSLYKIYDDFDIVHEPNSDWREGYPGNDWQEEWLEYIASCQPDLHAICTIIQQSQEMALKARIASVSPYLLLLRTEIRFSQSIKNIDFSTLRTLDASDLPGAVNTLCSKTLSDRFIQIYERLRALRNQIAHLGAPSLQIRSTELLEILFNQFFEIWPERMWLNDRYEYAATSRLGFFHDGSNTSAAMEVFHEMPFIVGMLQPSFFKRIFGHSKRTKRLLCPSCLYEATTDYSNLKISECTTAFRSADGSHARCAMCNSVFEVSEERCSAEDCRGTLRCSSAGEFDGVCLACGQ